MTDDYVGLASGDDWSEQKEFDVPQSFDEVKAKLDCVRARQGNWQGKKAFEILREVLKIIKEDLQLRGTFYVHPTGYYFFWESRQQLVLLDAKANSFLRLLMQYGIEAGETMVKAIAPALRIEAEDRGRKTDLYRFSHYDAVANRLFLSDFGGGVYIIEPKQIRHERNATHGILFFNKETDTPYRREDTHSSEVSLDAIFETINFVDHSLSIVEQRRLLKTWCYSLCFPELLPTRPILAMIGGPGSGKTTTLRLIGRILFGPGFNVTPLSHEVKDFDAVVTNEPFAAFDNADTRVPWLEDRLAIAATGGKIMRRGLYTDNELRAFPISAFVAITSRSPHFRREDVADRLLPMHLERRTNFTSEHVMLEKWEGLRNQLMTSIINDLQLIVRDLSEREVSSGTSTSRLADFAQFAQVCSRSLGWEDDISTTLDRLGETQSDFAAEGDSLTLLLDEWIPGAVGEDGEVTVKASELHAILAELGRKTGIGYTCVDPRALGRRLGSLEIPLGLRYGVTKEDRGGRKRYYTFRYLEREEAA